MKYKTLSELEDNYIGKHGTVERELYEHELSVEIIGEKIKELRKKRNLTQAQLGEMIGVKKSQISKIENNVKNVTFDTILRVMKALKARVKLFIEVDEYTKYQLI